MEGGRYKVLDVDRLKDVFYNIENTTNILS